MNPRERLLALGVLSVVVLAGTAFLFHRLFWIPLESKTAQMQALQQDVDKKRERIRQVMADKRRLDRWQQLSLPPDVNLSLREYERYLSELVRQSGIPAGGLTITPRPPDTKSSPAVGKVPVYTKLDFSVTGRTSLPHLVALLERFYRAPLLQQIKNLTIHRPLTRGPQQEQGDLDVTMTVEALILNGTDNRSHLLPNVNQRLLAVDVLVLNAQRSGAVGLAGIAWAVGPAGPLSPGSLAQPPRQYAAMADKNIFFGNQKAPVVKQRDSLDPTRFVHLVSITHNHEYTEASFYDQYNNRYINLRTDSGYDTFKIDDDRGETAVHGKVMLIDQRNLVFRVDDIYYSVHVHESLEEALRSPLTAEQVKSLGLAASVDKGPAME
jgi:hypothetical protein